jgi:predicted acetyltransferase
VHVPELIAPSADLFDAWLESHLEWGPGLHEDGFGLLATDDVESPEGFAAWVARLDAGRARCTYRWIVEDGRVLGAIVLRHEFTDYVLAVAGNIGYGIRPSARRRGLAAWALGQMLDEARARGLERVLVTCEASNVASARTIEHHGGVLEDIRDTGTEKVRRYWIDLDQNGTSIARTPGE